MAACWKDGVRMKVDVKVPNAFLYRCLGHFHGKFMEIIRLIKAPGNYSASIRSNKFSILSLEGPKPNKFMISGFLGLVGTRS